MKMIKVYVRKAMEPHGVARWNNRECAEQLTRPTAT